MHWARGHLVAMKRSQGQEIIAHEVIERLMYLIREHKVMLDSDLAELYDVPTKRLNEAVRRNPKRFPAAFMFRLTKDECGLLVPHIRPPSLGSKIATSSHGGRRYMP